MHLRISSAKRWQFRLGLNVLNGSRSGDRSKQTDIALTTGITITGVSLYMPHNQVHFGLTRYLTCKTSEFNPYMLNNVKKNVNWNVHFYPVSVWCLSQFVVKGPPSKHMTCLSYTLNVYSKYNINRSKSSAKAFPLYRTSRPTVV